MLRVAGLGPRASSWTGSLLVVAGSQAPLALAANRLQAVCDLAVTQAASTTDLDTLLSDKARPSPPQISLYVIKTTWRSTVMYPARHRRTLARIVHGSA